jgi:hypothetical protein
MWSYRKAWSVILAAFLGLVNMGQVQSVDQHLLVLVTPKEAAQLRLAEEE